MRATSSRNTANRPCHFFQQNGWCRFGESCKFSHDGTSHTTTAKSGTSSSVRGNERGEWRGDRLREWKRLLATNASSLHRRQASCYRFFELSLQLMDGDVGASQETVKLLAQDDGLSFIRDLAETHIPNAETNITKAAIWAKQIHPLFKLLTHPRVVASAVLEQHVAVLYNFLQGIGSRRMKLVFNFVIALLEMWPSLESSWPLSYEHGDELEATELCLAIMAKMIDSTTTNIINQDFQPIAESFELFLVAAEDSDNSFAKTQGWKHIRYIQRRLGVGIALPEAQAKQSAPVNRAEFILRRDLPGSLSAEGPRHDNDHTSIHKIRILPTQDEVRSPRSEYLPTNNTSEFHIPGIQGRLDREFRLLREDTVGQLRDAVRAELDSLNTPTANTSRRGKNSLRTYTYTNAKVHELSFGKQHGLDILVQFHQPAPKDSEKKRHDWWVQSKRLQPGGLVCVISADAPVLFCVVAELTFVLQEPKSKPNKHQGDQQASDKKQKPCLARDSSLAYVHLNVVETTARDIAEATRWSQEKGNKHSRSLVEFPGVLLASFQHTLQALQRVSLKPDLPFVELIAPEKREEALAEVSPPQYSTKPGFYFDLACLTKSKSVLRHSLREPMDPVVLAKHTTLDATQSVALIDALSTGLALIQGPPGTGKSFTGERLIKVLLANKQKANLGPILCVCYTNHALDQLLEHLYKDGVNSMIRIGSRSKSEVLENLNIRVVSSTADRTKSEKHELWLCETSLEESEKEMTRSLKQLRNCQSQSTIEQYLQEHHSTHHRELFGRDEEGYMTVHSHHNQLVDQWRHGGNTDQLPARELSDILNCSLWSLSRAERGRLHGHWVREIREPIFASIIDGMKSYWETRERRDKTRQGVDVRCLSGCDVIGVTTTGLARNLNLLGRLGCKVMLCEEAGEVLESHLLTALLPSVEHAILIGDHQQLRPQIQNYELQSINPRGLQYSLDVSLFERLVNPPHHGDPKLPFNTLQTQRRMHPQVSELIRETLYPSLEDGGSVSEYPEVRGMKKRLFWLHHEVLEDRAMQLDATTTSHTNEFEVKMTVALTQHLVKQGSYSPDDIAVITPYLGQLHHLRRTMEHMFEISVSERDQEELDALEATERPGEVTHSAREKLPAKRALLKSIRLATVDNFQGEEAKIIIISLVRSNAENKCGFLSTPNRINVLLSRAQHGMYLIGNSNTYGHVEMWAKVLSILERSGRLGRQFELQCPRHPDTPLRVSQPDHFVMMAPEGGCILPCDKRLACGHSCVNRCHSDMMHSAVVCLEPCPRPKNGCDHPCRDFCGNVCEPKCTEELVGINLALVCGHRVRNAKCWEAQNPSRIRCEVMIQKTIPGCGHSVTVPCHTDVKADNFQCPAVCGDALECGHSCGSQCHLCKARKDGEVTKVNHGICAQPCGRGYNTCRHPCVQACHGDKKCPPCVRPCEVRCSHSRCNKKCYEPCAPCAEQTCASECPHTKCTMPCGAPCNWVPCSERCPKTLGCGHRCPSLCGESCPDKRFCQECGSEDIKDTMVDFIMGMHYRYIDLDDDPCIFPDCGHFFTAANMDGVMEMAAHYGMSADGKPTTISNSSKPFSMDEVKVCPTCRGSLRNVARYGRIIRRAMLDEATKKFIGWSGLEYCNLAGRLIDIQEELSDNTIPKRTPQSSSKKILATGRLKQLELVRDCIGSDRYKTAMALWHEISAFLGRVRKEEQPFQQVANFVQHARRQGQTDLKFAFDEGQIQVGGELHAFTLGLRCETVIFADFMRVQKENPGLLRDRKLDLSRHMADCEVLVQRARAVKLPRQEVEGHVYYAHFCAVAMALTPKTAESLAPEEAPKEAADSARDQIRKKGFEHLEAARKVVKASPSTKELQVEIEAAERMLRDGVFYELVSPEEMRAVLAAMASEFRGTGHWYTCANGHPFTVGECGMPMERARCPECGSPVGGAYHVPEAGVTHAVEIENLGREVEGFRI